MTEFEKYATKHCGISSTTYAKYTSAINNSLTPYIVEERQLNVAQMDVFSRLMMDLSLFFHASITKNSVYYCIRALFFQSCLGFTYKFFATIFAQHGAVAVNKEDLRNRNKSIE